MKYKLLLKNGETRKAIILKYALYPTKYTGVGEVVYHTKQQIKEDDGLTLLEDDPHCLYADAGIIRGETELFSIYRSLKNPIVKLELEQSWEKQSCLSFLSISVVYSLG